MTLAAAQSRPFRTPYAMARTLDMPHSWQELLKYPSLGDHVAQVYQDENFLADAAAEYVGSGLRAGQAALIIATPAHRALFMRRLRALGVYPEAAAGQGQLRLLDAEETLAKCSLDDGRLDWAAFHETVGGTIAELRLQYPMVRAYGEIVDLLWQRGRKEDAIRLEEFWNELGKLQRFSLFCAYFIDNLDADAYGGPIECVCKTHTHLIPTRDYATFNRAVSDASKEVLDQPLAQMLLSLSATHRPPTQMPLGQATLLWLAKNMPRTAGRVLTHVRARRVLT